MLGPGASGDLRVWGSGFQGGGCRAVGVQGFGLGSICFDALYP